MFKQAVCNSKLANNANLYCVIFALVGQGTINFHTECTLCTEEEADNGRDRGNEIEPDGEVTEKGS